MRTAALSLRTLSDVQLDQIEETGLRLLGEVGISLGNERAREILRGHGCTVNGGRVLIPRDVVSWALANVKADRVVRTADGTGEVRLGEAGFLVHNTGGEPNILDVHTGERRPATLQDQADVTRLLDALPNVDVVTSLFAPQDVPGSLMMLASFETTLRHTRKPVRAPAAENPADARYLVELAAACCGGPEAFRRQPNTSIAVSPISPLTFSDKVVEAMLAVVEAGAPLHALPCPSMGATGPITLAGVLALQHAENLATFVLAAAACPGAQVGYCSRINPIDVRTAVSSWTGPEVGLAGACAAELAHRNGLTADVYGFCTAATAIDPQMAYDRLLNALTPALAGADILSGVGMLESGLTGSPVAAVIDDEIIGLMRHLMRGCEVNEQTLAFETMREVILGDGVFLGHEHTVEHMHRGALWMGEISERGQDLTGEAPAGVVARARERTLDLLRSHQVDPLPEDVSRQLTEIMDRARRELGSE